MTQIAKMTEVGASTGGFSPCESFLNNAPFNQGSSYEAIQGLTSDFRFSIDAQLAWSWFMPIYPVENVIRLSVDDFCTSVAGEACTGTAPGTKQMTDTACNDAAIGALRAKVSELEALNERLAQFAYAAAHDLEEPLRKIRQYGDLLVEDHSATLNKDGQFYVNVMTSSAQRLSSLVKNLLQFASASQGDLVLKPVDLEKPFQKALDDVQHPLEEVGMVTKMGSLPTVQCDEMLVQIVFNNLVLNAIKYRAPGRSPEMTIALAEDGDDLVLSFTDNGIGFDKSEADRIFEPFVRLGSKSEAQGTGIGLAICRTICERHNWSLTASGIKDSHARFEIRIPGANRND